jgi:hypothetical protein
MCLHRDNTRVILVIVEREKVQTYVADSSSAGATGGCNCAETMDTGEARQWRSPNA